MKRKLLKDLAGAIASSFISRNNDINGYYGVGALYKQTNELNTNQIQLDLLTGNTIPVEIDAKYTIVCYYEFFLKQLLSRNFQKNHIKKVTIQLVFNCTTNGQEKIYENIRWGNPFSCNVTITDDLEKDHTVKIISYCRIHDPKKENQSLRVEAYTKFMADQKK